MTKRDDILIHRNIISIDPGYSFQSGTGYAIFDHDSFRLKSCGLIRPFAPGLESHSCTIEIADKVKRAWEKEVGFSYDPRILCIEHPKVCFRKNGVNINSNSIIMLAVLGVRIEERFKSRTVLRPHPHNWKNRSNKEQTKNLVLNKLDVWSLKVLDREMSLVDPHMRHNVFDAVGLGLWAINKVNKN
ncbi:MAG: hypothetical protein KC505_11250 [Myxococcales bacterium]|nr:hypothetical protein [Myxococcales bacterium]